MCRISTLDYVNHHGDIAVPDDIRPGWLRKTRGIFRIGTSTGLRLFRFEKSDHDHWPNPKATCSHWEKTH